MAQTRLGQMENANEVLASIFRELDPHAEEKGGPGLRQQLSQHLERAVAQLDEAEIGDPVTVARVQIALGQALRGVGQAEPAVEILSKARKTFESEFGPDHPHTLQSRKNLANWGQKKYSEAEPLLVQGYEGMNQRRDKIPAPYRPIRLREALERLVRLYEATDQKDKAAQWRMKLQEMKSASK